jgi:hypothetical protein
MNSSYDAVLFTDMSTNLWHAKSAGAYRIATELRKKGYRTKVVDFFGHWLSDSKLFYQLLETVVSDQTLFIGFSGVFMTAYKQKTKIDCWDDIKEPGLGDWPVSTERMELYFKLIRKRFPNIKLVYGGISETRKIPEFVVENMDYVIRGLGDNTVIELADHLKNNATLKYMPSKGRARVLEHDMRAQSFDFIHGITEYQPEDHVMPGEVLPMETSRGCLFKCGFCDYPLIGRKKNDPEYHKTVETMALEFKKNWEQFGVNRYFFTDETFNESSAKIQDVIRARDLSGVDIGFQSYLRVDLLTRFPEQMTLLTELGINSCFFGIESLNADSARSIGKGSHPDQVKETIEKFKAINPNLAVFAGFIAGLPYDTPDNIRDWSQWLMNSNCPVDSFRFVPLHIVGNSILAQDPEKYGYCLTGDSANHWKNSTWDYRQASEFCDQLMQEAWHTDRLRWAGFDYLGIRNMNYSEQQLAQILAKPMNRMNFDELLQKQQEQWITYQTLLFDYEAQQLG